MKQDAKELLAEGLRRLGLPDAGEEARRLEGYADFFLETNLSLNLSATRDEGDFVVRHLLDSLSAHEHLPAGTLADIGTGGGLPGVPLSIFRKEVVTLVESKKKKCDFLRAAIARVGLQGVKVEERNANELPGRFAVITSRAFAEIGHTLRLTKSRMSPDGVFVFYKGRRETIDKEIKESLEPADRFEIRVVEVPFLEEERHLVLYRKG